MRLLGLLFVPFVAQMKSDKICSNSQKSYRSLYCIMVRRPLWYFFGWNLEISGGRNRTSPASCNRNCSKGTRTIFAFNGNPFANKLYCYSKFVLFLKREV
uniref:Secreted protein n=1 Tax=Pyxicephalus adspersus TaxID=30357 RepID=A0AAV3AYB8_PYXAD|nr:TPA: hypothetical protein GDO54_011370 [Pyxicephalus adspersus]